MISNPKSEWYDIITHINNIMEAYNLHMIIGNGNLFNIEHDFYWIFDLNENLSFWDYINKIEIGLKLD